MKQLLVLSGKGGTGKTTVASALIQLTKTQDYTDCDVPKSQAYADCDVPKSRVYADCDVDAPNLHLVMKIQGQEQLRDYYGMPKAVIEEDKCIACGLCDENCRFDAIIKGAKYAVDPFACEGCGVCMAVCPAHAVHLEMVVAGVLKTHNDGQQLFSTAQLKMGSGTSGMLVTEVKRQLQVKKDEAIWAIIDGSPGIGCPVIASLSGVDAVLLVTEPSLSGISDMERIIKTARIFQTQIFVCINKYDTHQKIPWQ